MAHKERVLFLFLFLLGIFSRLPFMEKMQSHWDAPQYSIGIIRYSLENHTPAPPGYPLYIAMGTIIYQFVHDPHTAIVFVSVLFGGIGAIVFYVVGKILFNKSTGIISSLLFLSAPTLYFFGVTANPYGALAITASVLAGIVHLIIFKKKQFGIMLGVALAFAIGFRPQDALFLPPLFILGVKFLKKTERYKAVLIFVLTSFAWFLPTVYFSGGVLHYLSQLEDFFRTGSSLDPSIFHVIAIWLILVKGFYLTLGISGVFLSYYLWEFLSLLRKKLIFSSKNKMKIFFFAVWILPSLLFNAFIRSDHAAHQMSYLAALIFLTSFAIWKLTRKNNFFIFSVTIIVVLFNLYTFFRDRDPGDLKPYVSQSYHYSEIRKNDLRMEALKTYIISNYKTSETLVIVDPEIFRPVTYYLKDYRVFAYSALDANLLPKVNTVHFGYKWNYKLSEEPTSKLLVPEGIKRVVVISNNKTYYINEKNVSLKILKNNATLYLFATKPGTVYDLFLHQIIKSD